MSLYLSRVWVLVTILLLVAVQKQVLASTSNGVSKNDKNTAVSSNAVQTTTTTTTLKDDADLNVVELTSRNFGRSLRGRGGKTRDVWLIEFYSPNCGHCVEFAPTYAEIARHYHGLPKISSDNTSTTKNFTSNNRNIKVGRVNGDAERALITRFGIQAYPSFFVVDGWNVYEFHQRRIKQFMMAFVEGGYKKENTQPFYSSPMGPMGMMQGLMMAVGHNGQDLFIWTQNILGLSPLLVAMVLFGSLFMGSFFLIVLLAILIPPRQKRD